MRLLTDTELKQLKTLELKLKKAVPHSTQAIALGRQIAEVYRQARLRQPPDLVMDQLSKALMNSLP